MYLTYQDISNAKQQPNATDPFSQRSILQEGGIWAEIDIATLQVPPVDIDEPSSPLFTPLHHGCKEEDIVDADASVHSCWSVTGTWHQY